MSRIGDYILTYTGVKFYPADPRIEDFNLEDIAHALSHVNRYNGHTTAPYSVAQHAVNVATVLEQLGYSARTRFIGLNHDNPEAYMADIPSPVKQLLPDYAKLEKKLQDMLYEWCGLGKVSKEEYEVVKFIDGLLYFAEARSLLPKYSTFTTEVHLKDMVIVPWPPEKAKLEFINLWNKLKREMESEGN